VNETILRASQPVGAPPNGAEIRLERVLDAVNARRIDAMVVTSDESIAYLTGFRPHQLERFFGVVLSIRGGAVIVPRLDEGQVEAPANLAESATTRVRRFPGTRARLGSRSDGRCRGRPSELLPSAVAGRSRL